MRPDSGRIFGTTFQPSFTVSLGPKLRPPATHSLTGPQTRRLPKDPHMMHRDHPDPMRLGLLGLGWVWVGFGMVWFGGRCMDWVSQVHDGTNGVGMRAEDTPRNGGPGTLAFSPILKRVGATDFGRFDCILRHRMARWPPWPQDWSFKFFKPKTLGATSPCRPIRCAKRNESGTNRWPHTPETQAPCKKCQQSIFLYIFLLHRH